MVQQTLTPINQMPPHSAPVIPIGQFQDAKPAAFTIFGDHKPVTFDASNLEDLVPSDVLPPEHGFADFITALTWSHQTPKALGVMFAMSVLATCVQRRFVVSPTHKFIEPTCLATMTLLDRGEGKSPVVLRLRAPLDEYEHKENARLQIEISRVAVERSANTKRIAKLEDEAAKTDDAAQRKAKIEEAGALRANIPDEQFELELYSTNATMEGIEKQLAEQKGFAAILTDEAGAFLAIAGGLYSDGNVNVDTALQAMCGGSIRVIRQSRKCHIPRAYLSAGLTPQPKTVAGLGQSKLRDNGFVARFLPCMPPSLVGSRDMTKLHVDKNLIELESQYEKRVLQLLTLPQAKDNDGKPIHTELTLSTEAMDEWLAFRQWIEERQGEGRKFYPIQDWTCKLAGYALRIAGIQHIWSHWDAQKPNPVIGLDTMKTAISLAKALIPHTCAVFEMSGMDEATRDARYLQSWILDNEGAIIKQGWYVKQNDIHRLARFKNHKIERVLKALQILVDRHIISVRDELPTKKPTLVYHVNPLLFQEERQEINLLGV